MASSFNYVTQLFCLDLCLLHMVHTHAYTNEQVLCGKVAIILVILAESYILCISMASSLNYDFFALHLSMPMSSSQYDPSCLHGPVLCFNDRYALCLRVIQL